MNLDGLAGKAKEAASNNRDRIDEQADKLIDSKIQGENADKAKAGVDKGLDSLLGKGDQPAEAPKEEPNA